MKTTMRSRVRAYLAERRTLGFRLRSEGYLLLNFARYADGHASRGRLTNKLAIAWAGLFKDADRHCWKQGDPCVAGSHCDARRKRCRQESR